MASGADRPAVVRQCAGALVSEGRVGWGRACAASSESRPCPLGRRHTRLLWRNSTRSCSRLIAAQAFSGADPRPAAALVSPLVGRDLNAPPPPQRNLRPRCCMRSFNDIITAHAAATIPPLPTATVPVVHTPTDKQAGQEEKPPGCSSPVSSHTRPC